MPKFKKYIRKGYTEMRPYVNRESMYKIHIEGCCTIPEVGDMIARHPDFPDALFHVTKEYFNEHFWEVKDE